MNDPQADTLMFPIMGGPSVPWEVMLPHENQAQKNHGQTLHRLAERGGLGPHEAWAVVNGLNFFEHSKEEVSGWESKWREFASQTNQRYERPERELSEAKRKLDGEHICILHNSIACNECANDFRELEKERDALRDIADRLGKLVRDGFQEPESNADCNSWEKLGRKLLSELDALKINKTP